MKKKVYLHESESFEASGFSIAIRLIKFRGGTTTAGQTFTTKGQRASGRIKFIRFTF